MPLIAGVLALTLWKTHPLTRSEFQEGLFSGESGRQGCLTAVWLEVQK